METVGQTRVKLGYLGGFFDGEGCVGLYKRTIKAGSRPGQANDRTHFVPSITVTNTNRLPLQGFVSEFGGRIKTTERKGNHRTCYTWDLRGLDNIMNFVEAIGEYTLAKSSELAVLMEVCESMKLTGRQPLTEEELNNRLTASNKLKEMKREGNG